jgi:hypothetical protein
MPKNRQPPAPGRAWSIADTVAATERAQQAAAELRQATRAAHEAAQDLREAAREHAASVKAAVEGEIRDQLRAFSGQAMDDMTTELGEVTRMAEARILRRLEAIYDAWIAGEGEGPSVAELMAARQKLRKGIERATADRAVSGHPRAAGIGGAAAEPGQVIDG